MTGIQTEDAIMTRFLFITVGLVALTTSVAIAATDVKPTAKDAKPTTKLTASQIIDKNVAARGGQKVWWQEEYRAAVRDADETTTHEPPGDSFPGPNRRAGLRRHAGLEAAAVPGAQ
jgi:hypothetical protein